ncbi:MAG: translation elongation factor 4 [Candidatus Colwellbacteria bacterium]|nr:translation elongation factor 4 [Candidatus Colwellbacteria bacterium]
MERNNIRNFCIIAHIDHGKSTLADRFLEVTETVSPHKMRAQYLDALELERERGITIKMAPVRMNYKFEEENYILNLIDTPGHSDFSYEVSRALKAVEGAILLVDAAQGIQAQTLANLEAAKRAGLKIIGALNKVDLKPAGMEELQIELAELIGVNPQEIHQVSGKTGEGVGDLLSDVVRLVPPPKLNPERAALIFSSLYDDHKGVIAFVRVFGGEFKRDTLTTLQAVSREFKVKEVGYFTPEFTAGRTLRAGEVGYIATGIKEPDAIRIGDTIGETALTGFQLPLPVMFVSLYPSDASEYDDLKVALGKLKLNDASLTFTADFSEVLGRGFKCGFLGRLHFEITTQRLEQEFNLEVVSSFPSVAYKVLTATGEELVENPKDFPENYEKVWEPYVAVKMLAPQRFLASLLELTRVFRFGEVRTQTFSDQIQLVSELPLSDLILDFDDRLKSVSQGFASFSYELLGFKEARVKKLDVLVAGEMVPGLSRIVPEDSLDREARKMAERLKELLPRQQFAQAIQAVTGGKIVAREDIPALKKNVTGHLYGGDRTRKMKLWKKQEKGKKKLKERGRVTVAPEVFRELLKK